MAPDRPTRQPTSLESELGVEVAEDSVVFTYTVTNAGDEPVTREFRTSRQADLRVTDDGREAWHWGKRRAVRHVLTTLELPPGESETYEFTWEDPPSGSYTATAGLGGSPGTEAASAASTTFTVP